MNLETRGSSLFSNNNNNNNKTACWALINCFIGSFSLYSTLLLPRMDIGE